MFLFKTLRILTLKLGFKKAAAGSVTAMLLKFHLLYNLIILNFSILLYGQKNVSIKTGKKLLVSFIKSKSECYSRWIMSNIYSDIKPLTVSANDICLAAMYTLCNYPWSKNSFCGTLYKRIGEATVTELLLYYQTRTDWVVFLKIV